MRSRDPAPDPLDTTLALPDGRWLQLHDWPGATAREGVLIVHGLGEHGARYAPLAAWLNARGYAVRSYDQAGHGRSPGRRGALAHPLELLGDLAAVLADYVAALGAPPLLLGHSMGGTVALRAVLEGRVAVRALVLSSPALRTWVPGWQQSLATRLARVLPGLPLRSGLPFRALSHDPDVVVAYRHDPLRSGWITPRLARFIFESGPYCIRHAAALAVPTLLLVAGADRLVDPRGSLAFAEAARPGGHLTVRVYDALCHELFNEAEPARREVLADLQSWLAQRRPVA
ncbi:lysophospholipase [Fulvimonas yonginensis]